MRKLLEKYPDFNFFMSPKFLEVIIKAEELEFNGYEILAKEGYYFIPPPNKAVKGVYVDYEGYVGKGEKLFWDNEYIYNSKDVFEMKGRKYRVFRHNVNKFKENNDDWDYKKGSWDDVLTVYEEWLKTQKEIYNDWIFYAEGLPFKILYLKGEPVAFNVWDVGLKYIHFIFNHSLNIPFLNEFSRWLFYKEVYETYGEILINDGGDMGLEGLKRYKMKLNPVEVRKRYGWW